MHSIKLSVSSRVLLISLMVVVQLAFVGGNFILVGHGQEATTDSAVEPAPAPAVEPAPAPASSDETIVEPAPAPAPEPAPASTTDSAQVDSSNAETSTAEVAPTPELSISPEQSEYFPNQPISIIGKFFSAITDFIINIFATNDDGSTYTAAPIPVTSDVDGSFAASYTLDSVVHPLYTIVASDSSGTTIAQTTFTDPGVGFDLRQCAQNDKQGNTPLGLGYCNWIGSSLGSNNSKLYEGMATEQQLLVTGMSGSSHTMRVGIQATKAQAGVAYHAYDWLVSDAITPDSTKNSEQASAADGITLQLNRCGAQMAGSNKTACDALVAGTNYVDISVPDDAFVSVDGSTQSRIDAYEALFSNRTVRIYSNAAITGTPTMTLVHKNGKTSGATTTSPGGDAGIDTFIWYTITWTSSGTNALLEAGADISQGGDGTGRTWGAGRGATGVSGDPYHFYLIDVDGTGGSLDNQMSAGAVFASPQGLISGVKFNDLNGNGVKEGGDVGLGGWTITLTGSTSSSTVTASDGTYSFGSLADGTYTVCETFQGGWTQTFPTTDPGSCTDGNGYSVTIIGGVNTPSGSLDFGNTQKAHLTLVKTVTNDNGGTASTTAWTLNASGTTPISGTTGSGAVTNAAVNAGTYSLSESGGPTGYASSTYSCVKNAGAPVVSNSITLAAGDTATCTINNNDIVPSLTLNKITSYTYGGTAPESSWTLTATGTTPISGPGAAGSADVVSGPTFSAGTYTLSESAAPTGYTNGASYSCVKNGGAPVSGNSIVLALGDTAVCSITNTDVQPKLTVTKVVINHGGNKVVSDFPLFVATTSVTSGVQNGFNAGSYTVSETSNSNYTETITGDCASNGSITLAVGDVKSCTITNEEKPSMVVVHKVVINHGLLNDATHFAPYMVGSTTVTLDATTTMNSGSYVVSEATDTNYTSSFTAGDCDGSGNITLTPGTTKSCTITNEEIPTHLMVTKVVINHGGSKVVSDFPLTVDSGSVTSGVNNLVNSGVHVVAETSNPDYTATITGDCDGSGNVTLAPGANGACTIVNEEKTAKLTIVKDAQPNDLIDFSFNGTGGIGSFLLDDDNGVADIGLNGDVDRPNSKVSSTLNTGSYTITETEPNSFWTLGSATCVNTVGSTPYSSTLSGTALSVTLTPGADVTCTFVNNKKSPTRTLGFWQTHTAYTSSTFSAAPLSGSMFIGNGTTHKGPVDTIGKIFGAFYSSIPKMTVGGNRTALDKARMQLLQQLVAAKLNCASFGCAASDQATITAADGYYATGTAAQILVSASLLDAFNNSGDTITIGPAGSATPKTSQSLANKVFWDAP